MRGLGAVEPHVRNHHVHVDRCQSECVISPAYSARGHYYGYSCGGTESKAGSKPDGFFVNTLVLRNRLSRDVSFSRLLQQVKDECAGAYAHQDYPFDKLLQVLNRPRRLNRAPLFDVLINFAAGSKNEENFGESRWKESSWEMVPTRTSLT